MAPGFLRLSRGSFFIPYGRNAMFWVGFTKKCIIFVGMLDQFEAIKPPLYRCRGCGKVLEKGLVSLGKHTTECDYNTFTINLDKSWDEMWDYVADLDKPVKCRIHSMPRLTRLSRICKFLFIPYRKWTYTVGIE